MRHSKRFFMPLTWLKGLGCSHHEQLFRSTQLRWHTTLQGMAVHPTSTRMACRAAHNMSQYVWQCPLRNNMMLMLKMLTTRRLSFATGPGAAAAGPAMLLPSASPAAAAARMGCCATTRPSLCLCSCWMVLVENPLKRGAS